MTTMAVLIGRMQPPHMGHAKLVERMLAEHDHVLVLFGSSCRSRDTKNPLRWDDRAWLLRRLLNEIGCDDSRMRNLPLKDYPYANNRWQYQVQKIVEAQAQELGADTIVLYGNYKDGSSWYLELFPRWERQEIPFFKPDGRILNASDIRDPILRGVDPWTYADLIGKRGADWLTGWRLGEEGSRLVEEAAWIDNFKEPYKDLPYGIIFQTADSVITWRGLVLLGQRRGNPGRGLWALPGGYVNEREWIAKGAFRELGEEARTKVYLRGRNGRRRLKFDESWMVGSKTYDWPDRSQRGRVITTRYHWRIPDHLDVAHEAADDLQRTQFFPIHDVLDNMDYDMFEDHQMIVGDTVLRY
jgi:bifunctional NMN adenylyltransferase/nudix hydrolase